MCRPYAPTGAGRLDDEQERCSHSVYKGTVCSSSFDSSHVFRGQGGSEIPVEATTRIEACTKTLKQLKGLSNQWNYKEPVNGHFGDCTTEVLPSEDGK